MRSKFNVLTSMLIGLALFSAVAIAQELPPLPPGGAVHIQVGPPGMVTAGTFSAGEGEAVKGAPFSTKLVTTQKQVFADGNEIVHTNTTNFYRDSEGRVRREVDLVLPGAMRTKGGAKIITITDPVNNVIITLDPERKTATKIAMPRMEGSTGALRGRNNVVYMRTESAGGPSSATGFAYKVNSNVSDKQPGDRESKSRTEDLGEDVINGVVAKGTRITTTIEAQKIGNTKPITVKSESWYSPELQFTLRTMHIDPWAGTMETTAQDLVKGEPDASLFKIPSDFAVVDKPSGSGFNVRIEGPPSNEP